ncbi:MAG: hypothetical protein ACAI43_25245 [Phycisphaerae bacterium]|nr:hypothetical protein [Tepidisphaeraceae bacterium]
MFRRYWPIFALLAGAALIAFELHRDGGVTGENAFWLVVGGVIVLMGLIDLLQRITGKLPEPPEKDDKLPLQ